MAMTSPPIVIGSGARAGLVAAAAGADGAPPRLAAAVRGERAHRRHRRVGARGARSRARPRGSALSSGVSAHGDTLPRAAARESERRYGRSRRAARKCRGAHGHILVVSAELPIDPRSGEGGDRRRPGDAARRSAGDRGQHGSRAGFARGTRGARSPARGRGSGVLTGHGRSGRSRAHPRRARDLTHAGSRRPE